VLPNENLLGVTLTAAIPFAYLGFRGRARVWFLVYLTGMAAATGSRTAIGAALVTLIVLLVVRPNLDRDLVGFSRKAIAWLTLGTAIAASLLVLGLTGESQTLTGRPQLWSVASDYIHRSPWIGYGPRAWQGLYTSSEIPEAAQRSAHNLWMDVFFVGGAVGSVFFVAMLVAAIASAGRAQTGLVLTLGTIFMIGTTEGVWSIGTFDFASFSFVAFMLIGQDRHANPSPHLSEEIYRPNGMDLSPPKARTMILS
jgi:O-antigen ligase